MNTKTKFRLLCAALVLAAASPVCFAATFSDANWVSMGSFPGANGEVRAVAVDASRNVYIGGSFTIVGDVFATNIAKWNGSSWSALGPGMQDDPFGFSRVSALAVLGSNLYAGGEFTIPGASPATNIAKWDGNTWSPLGSGLTIGNDTVHALAVSGSDLYVGGSFTTAGGIPANNIAKWNGGSWSALGSGMDLFVYALAVSGSNVYAGGQFTTAGGTAANNIAKWNGSSWSALGSGMAGDIMVTLR